MCLPARRFRPGGAAVTVGIRQAAVWRTEAPLAPAQRRVFDDLLPYCVPELSSCTCVHEATGTTVRFEEQPGWNRERTAALLDLAFQRASEGGTRPPRVLFDINGDGRQVRPHSAPQVSVVGPGLQVVGPELSRPTTALDALFLDLAVELGAEQYSVPQLISRAVIERVGYARTFPQHLTCCTVVGPDLAALDRFAAATDRSEWAEELVSAEVALAPAVCTHLFAALADRTLEGPFIATARGSCGRYEAGFSQPGNRLWSFDMREIVFVGTAAEARGFRQTLLDTVTALARELDLPCQLATANDPFFTLARGELATFQESFALKHELIGRPADGTTPVAVTSVNLHTQHFGKAFGITLADGTPAHSVCIGFGLDRWARWIHGHVGGDPADWPGPLRRADRGAARESGRGRWTEADHDATGRR